MSGYYTEKLAAERLRACYELAPPRVQTYLESEICFVLSRVSTATTVLELGCGYGRVLRHLVSRAGSVVGIDTSPRSLQMAREIVASANPPHLLVMDAARMGFRDHVFDLTICIQNGICAFGVDPGHLLLEALRVARPGGTLLFSTYSDRFWPHRLEWFESQAREGLIGPIDHAASRDGVIVCTDGFRAGRATPEELRALCLAHLVEPVIMQVDGSSVFCRITKPVP